MEEHVFEEEQSVMIAGPVLHMPSDSICRICGKEKMSHQATWSPNRASIVFVPRPGINVADAAAEMVRLSIQHQREIVASFNDIPLTATPHVSADALVSHYHAETEARRRAYVASPEYAEAQAQAKELQEVRDASLKGALLAAPDHLTVREGKDAEWQETVDKHQDAYGAVVVAYAERWARLMECRIAAGDTVEGCADEASHLADNKGITGFMYGCAVNILASVWIHGEQLRVWHNLATQIGTEGEKANASGGVLYPAVLSFGAVA